MFSVIAYKNPVDARIVFDYGWKFQNAFCAFGAPMPVSLLVGFPFDGRIGGQSEKTPCFILKPSLLKNS
jgi:hypothetical protein